MKNDSSENVIVSSVLIETLWNVNLVKWQLLICTVCINRNIVECKCPSNGALGGSGYRVLIETLWNVNNINSFIHSLEYSY